MAIFFTALNGNVMQTIVVLCIFYVACTAIYRLYFSPLARVPGPRAAALTGFYEFYWDGIRKGQMVFHTKELHDRFGPIVRIGPNSVHINDAGYYDTVYAGGGEKNRRDKVRHLALHDDSMFDTYDGRLHRKRRAALSAPFSKQSINALAPAIWDIATGYADKLAASAKVEGQVVELKALWNALTQEVIGRYCFGAADMAGLRGGSQEAQFLGLFDNWPHMNAWGRAFPWFFDSISRLPLTVLARLSPKFETLGRFEAQMARQIADVLARDEPLVGSKNVFCEMRDSKHLPARDKTMAYYKNEAISFIGAGTETTAGALVTLSYHLLANPHMLQRVRDELRTVMPRGSREMPKMAELEALPYLTGVVQEGIRLAHGVPGRLPRTAPTQELVYAGHRLPPGTIISQSAYLVHTDPRYFPDPMRFEPERWINNRSALTPYFLAFSRGARGCVGINLAYADLYLTIAAVFTRVDLQLHDTTDYDVSIVADGFIGLRPQDSKGVRVKVLGEIA